MSLYGNVSAGNPAATNTNARAGVLASFVEGFVHLVA